MAAQTVFEMALENDTIPLAKRIEASIGGRTGKVKTYDHWGSDMDAISDPNTGFTALMVAAKSGNVMSVEILVNRGADPNFRSERRGRTALHTAAKYGQYDCVNLLINLGAQINMTDLAGGTALMHASKAGYEQIVALLLRRGAGINLTDRNGWAAIHFSAKFGHKPVCEILVRAGAATAIQDSKEGKNPLMVRHCKSLSSALIVTVLICSQACRSMHLSSVDEKRYDF
jgi:ankyrin repeat protein